jgi:hypothetical protein
MPITCEANVCSHEASTAPNAECVPLAECEWRGEGRAGSDPLSALTEIPTPELARPIALCCRAVVA